MDGETGSIAVTPAVTRAKNDAVRHRAVKLRSVPQSENTQGSLLFIGYHSFGIHSLPEERVGDTKDEKHLGKCRRTRLRVPQRRQLQQGKLPRLPRKANLRRLRFLRNRLQRMANVRYQHASPREAYVQALLSAVHSDGTTHHAHPALGRGIAHITG